MAVKVYWTRQSREDLREIRTFIARDAPLTAAAFVRRIRESVKRARVFPELGQVVPELGRNEIRGFLHLPSHLSRWYRTHRYPNGISQRPAA